MHVFEMVVLIVAIGGIISIVTKILDNKNSKLSDKWRAAASEWGMSMDDDGNPVSFERLKKLEERVAVLEKIVTDRNYDLRKEFERL